MSRSKWLEKFKGMPNGRKYWKVFRDTNLLDQVELYYRHWLDFRIDEYFIEQMEDFVKRSREVRFKMNTYGFTYTHCATNSLGNCTTAATPCSREQSKSYLETWYLQQEQGNNPMRVDFNTPTASASIINAKSDEAYQREYLLEQLESFNKYTWKEDSKYGEFRELFNIDAPTTPRTSKELLDAFQNGKFTVDEKKVAFAEKARNGGLDNDDPYNGSDDGDYYSPFYGITFTDLPKEDRKGYNAAVVAFEKARKDTERKIIVGTPSEGLDALLALEAWLPVGKAN